MRKKEILTLALVVLLLGTLSSCGGNAPTRQTLQSPLPTATGVLSSSKSPLPAPTGTGEVIPFRLDKPLLDGATFVTGGGPPGVTVRLEDVTFMGRPIAQGQIGQDGKFKIVLPAPLEAQHRVGLAVDLTGQPSSPDGDFSSEFYGEEALLVPQVGFYYDTAMVQKP